MTAPRLAAEGGGAGPGVALTDLLADPSRAVEVAPGAIPAYLVQLAAIQSALAARLAVVAAQERPPVGEVAPEAKDRWLTPQQAAEIANVGVRWLYPTFLRIPL